MLGCMLQSLRYTASIPKGSFPLAMGKKGIILPFAPAGLANLPNFQHLIIT